MHEVIHFKISFYLDYGRLTSQQRSTPLKGFPQLKISQEYKGKDLIASGNFTKQDIELVLENILFKHFKREVDVYAEEFPGTTDMWRITTDHEGKSISH